MANENEKPTPRDYFQMESDIGWKRRQPKPVREFNLPKEYLSSGALTLNGRDLYAIYKRAAESYSKISRALDIHRNNLHQVVDFLLVKEQRIGVAEPWTFKPTEDGDLRIQVWKEPRRRGRQKIIEILHLKDIELSEEEIAEIESSLLTTAEATEAAETLEAEAMEGIDTLDKEDKREMLVRKLREADPNASEESLYANADRILSEERVGKTKKGFGKKTLQSLA